MDRRGFLGSILLAAVAPAIVRADSLMRIVPRETIIAAPSLAEIEAMLPPSEAELAAAFAGAVRHLWQYDILRDLYVHRLDYTTSSDGKLREGDSHMNVSFEIPSSEQERADFYDRHVVPALSCLRQTAFYEGHVPKVGALVIPDGVHGKFL